MRPRWCNLRVNYFTIFTNSSEVTWDSFVQTGLIYRQLKPGSFILGNYSGRASLMQKKDECNHFTCPFSCQMWFTLCYKGSYFVLFFFLTIQMTFVFICRRKRPQTHQGTSDVHVTASCSFSFDLSCQSERGLVWKTRSEAGADGAASLMRHSGAVVSPFN